MKKLKSSVYVETTVVSYLTARPSRDIVLAVHQQITHEWWERRDRFQLFVSQAVITEASMVTPTRRGADCWREQLEKACREQGYQPPVICTPEELTED